MCWDCVSMSGRNKCWNELSSGGLRGKAGWILTQVSCHQISIVEILHAQSNNVDELLYDLHELHCSRVDLHKIKKDRGTLSNPALLPLFHNCGNRWSGRNKNKSLQIKQQYINAKQRLLIIYWLLKQENKSPKMTYLAAFSVYKPIIYS